MKKQDAQSSAAGAPPPLPAEETTAVVPAASTEVGEAVDLSMLFAQDSADFAPKFGPESLSIPYLRMLQKGSPEVDEANAAYIAGAAPGMLINTVTNELFDARQGKGGVEMVMCDYDRKYVEWIPIENNGGGFVAAYEPGAKEVLECEKVGRNKLKTKSGNDMVETAYHFVTLRSQVTGQPFWAVFSATSTKLPGSKKWCTIAAEQTVPGPKGPIPAPLFSQVYRIFSVPEQKDRYSWFSLEVEHVGKIKEVDLYLRAKEYAKALKNNAAQIGAPPSEDRSGSGKSDEVPF